MNRALSAVFHYWSGFSPAYSVDEMWIARKSRATSKMSPNWAQPAAVRNGAFRQLNAFFVRCQRDYS